MGALNNAVAAVWGVPARLRAAVSNPSAMVPVDIDWSLLWGAPAKSGASVTVDTTLKCAVAFACTRVLAEGIAQLPLKVFREDGKRGKQVARDHPAHRIISRRPNPWMSSFEFRETLMYHAVLTGNGYAAINRVGGAIKELIPIMPGTVTVKQLPNYKLLYEVRFNDGGTVTVPEENMFHLRGPSWNGFMGLDTIKLMREAIGLAISTEENHARLHSQGARPGGILSTEGNLDDEQLKRIKAAWFAAQGGLGNAFKTAVLDGGMKWTPMAMTGVDSQHIETRKHQIEEVCRGFRVFPQMVGFGDKTATYASAEQFFLAHVTHSLGPWMARWEQTIDSKLLGKESEAMEGRLFSKFNVTALLRGDAKTRSQFYHNGILDGWMTRNEVRGFEDLNPKDGLDEPLVPLNMDAGKTTDGEEA